MLLKIEGYLGPENRKLFFISVESSILPLKRKLYGTSLPENGRPHVPASGKLYQKPEGYLLPRNGKLYNVIVKRTGFGTKIRTNF